MASDRRYAGNLDRTNKLGPSFTARPVDSSEILAFEVTAQGGGGAATDSVPVEVWVAGQNPNDATLLAHFCAKPGWACDRDPVAVLELTTRELGDVTEYHTNGIPDRATGTFPNQGNPNTIHTVFQTWHVLKMPERSAVGTEMATLGIMLDGLKLRA